jgi:hypothetical protein
MHIETGGRHDRRRLHLDEIAFLEEAPNGAVHHGAKRQDLQDIGIG